MSGFSQLFSAPEEPKYIAPPPPPELEDDTKSKPLSKPRTSRKSLKIDLGSTGMATNKTGTGLGL